MDEDRQKILIIEDDLDVANMLNAYFSVQGYDVMTVNWGEDGWRACQNSQPDLVILDLRLPDIDGSEVARRMRSTRRLKDIPIIFLAERGDQPDRLQGLDQGADDYIIKPFDVQELRLRIRNTMRRANHDSFTNPVTSLPDGKLVDERLGDCLQQNNWSALIISLDNLDIFREAYGFVASDDVMRAVSLMIQNAINELGSPDAFLGHLSQTDFVLIASPDLAKQLYERVRKRLEQSLDYFYPIKDRGKASSQTRRLAVKVGMMQGGIKTFDSAEQLKLALLRGKH